LQSAVGSIPTADSLPLKSTAVASSSVNEPPARATEDMPQRDSWMVGPDDGLGGAGGAGGSGDGDGDLFSSFGTERKRKDPNEKKPDPAKVRAVCMTLKIPSLTSVPRSFTQSTSSTPSCSRASLWTNTRQMVGWIRSG
jgi:hypothetical protein